MVSLEASFLNCDRAKLCIFPSKVSSSHPPVTARCASITTRFKCGQPRGRVSRSSSTPHSSPVLQTVSVKTRMLTHIDSTTFVFCIFSSCGQSSPNGSSFSRMRRRNLKVLRVFADAQMIAPRPMSANETSQLNMTTVGSRI